MSTPDDPAAHAVRAVQDTETIEERDALLVCFWKGESVLVGDGDYVPMVDLVPLLEYPKRWPAEHCTLAFQGNVHVLSDADYHIIEDAVRGK